MSRRMSRMQSRFNFMVLFLSFEIFQYDNADREIISQKQRTNQRLPVCRGRWERGVRKTKKFDVLKAITDEKKFSELVFDLVKETKTPDAFREMLSEELTEEGLRTILSVARSDYPLSLERRQ